VVEGAVASVRIQAGAGKIVAIASSTTSWNKSVRRSVIENCDKDRNEIDVGNWQQPSTA
jgi:hypothetical protein